MIDHPLQEKRPFPWKKATLILFTGVVVTLVATWFIIDISGKRSLENAIEEAHALGVPESWDHYRQEIEIPDDENFAKHPFVLVGNFKGDFDKRAKQLGSLKQGFYFEPRLGLEEPTLTFSEAVELVADEKDLHASDLKKLSNALQ